MYRESYRNIKLYYLESGYNWCKRKFKNGKVNGKIEPIIEWSGASYDWENSYELDIEKLMLAVVEIICYAGRCHKPHIINLDNIKKILSENSIEDLVKDLEEEEKAEFLYELNLVLNNQELEDEESS